VETHRTLCWNTMLFFFNDAADAYFYTLSLHDALPIYIVLLVRQVLRIYLLVHKKFQVLLLNGTACLVEKLREVRCCEQQFLLAQDRKSTRLNSSHVKISYAVFCLKKKIEANSLRLSTD